MGTDRILEITRRLGADVNEFLRRVDVTVVNDGYLRFSRGDDPTRHVEVETNRHGTKVFIHRAGGDISGSGPYGDLNKALDVAAMHVRELLRD